MKYLYVGLLIIALLVGGCFWSQRAVAERAEAVAGPLEAALAAYEGGDAEAARGLAAEAAAEWAKHEGVLASLISHDHTNGIAEALAELQQAPEEELGSRLAGVLKAVRSLAEMERTVWRNVF